MEIVDDVKRELIDWLKCAIDNPESTDETVLYMFELGLLDNKTVLRYVIRLLYYRRLSMQNETKESCFTIKVEIADKLDVELDFVNNAIYKYTHLSIR